MGFPLICLPWGCKVSKVCFGNIFENSFLEQFLKIFFSFQEQNYPIMKNSLLVYFLGKDIVALCVMERKSFLSILKLEK